MLTHLCRHKKWMKQNRVIGNFVLETHGRIFWCDVTPNLDNWRSRSMRMIIFLSWIMHVPNKKVIHSKCFPSLTMAGNIFCSFRIFLADKCSPRGIHCLPRHLAGLSVCLCATQCLSHKEIMRRTKGFLSSTVKQSLTFWGDRQCHLRQRCWMS